MSDLIRRQDATSIPVLPKEHREYQTNNLDDAYELGWYDCQKYIWQLPSAQKTGKWKHDGSQWENRWVCGCGYKLFFKPTNYCPNCGARMEREEE